METSELSTRTGYSADVRLHLAINGRAYALAQVAPEFLIIDCPVDVPPCRGEVVVTVDGRESRRPVSLVDGISESSHFVSIAEI